MAGDDVLGLRDVAEGAHTLLARAGDGQGQCSVSASVAIVVDASPPSVEVARPAAGWLYLAHHEAGEIPGMNGSMVLRTPALTVRGDAADAGLPGAAVVQVAFRFFGWECVAGPPAWECGLPLGSGFFVGPLEAVAQDRAGNEARATRSVLAAG